MQLDCIVKRFNIFRNHNKTTFDRTLTKDQEPTELYLSILPMNTTTGLQLV